MKDALKNIWINCQSAGYTVLTLVAIVLIVLGSILALPLVLVLVVGAVVFIAYKIGMTEDIDEDKPYDLYKKFRSHNEED
jgi:flagellar biosynthesis component FlhA